MFLDFLKLRGTIKEHDSEFLRAQQNARRSGDNMTGSWLLYYYKATAEKYPIYDFKLLQTNKSIL
jgi:hypothetical protein